MDPNAAAAIMRDGTVSLDERIEAAHDLRRWLDKGGYPLAAERAVLAVVNTAARFAAVQEVVLFLIAAATQKSAYEEVDTSYSRHGELTWPENLGIEHDGTRCARCDTPIGPVLVEDLETGYDRGAWVLCFTGPLGLLCEDCTVEVEAQPCG